jgi:hypothetical protein
MTMRLKLPLSVIAFILAAYPVQRPAAQVPLPISAAHGAAIAALYHAEGVQVYECAPAAGGQLAWQSREPVATLIADGNTVGRHYEGPKWEHIDGSVVRGKPVASIPAKTQGDIPWLKLEVVGKSGKGIFSGVTTVQRINTQGGVAHGACEEAGSFRSVPYSADYVFLRED